MVGSLVTLILVFNTLNFDADSLEIAIDEIEVLKQEVSEIRENLERFETEKHGINEHVSSIDERLTENEYSTSELNETVSEQEAMMSSLGEHYDELSNYVGEFNNYLNTLENKLDESNTKIDSLNSKAGSLENSLLETEEILQERVAETREYASSEINHLSSVFSRNQMYGIGIGICFLLLLGFGFVIVRRKIRQSSDGLYQQIEQTRSNLESEALKLDNKLIELLESQLKILQSEKEHSSTDTQEDHSLALKIADEVTRLERNLSHMDESVKGYKQLKAGLKRIKDNFTASGYELVELLNQPFHEGMKVKADFITDESLNSEKQFISKVIKPQVNYKGKMIQSAEVEVKQGA